MIRIAHLMQPEANSRASPSQLAEMLFLTRACGGEPPVGPATDARHKPLPGSDASFIILGSDPTGQLVTLPWEFGLPPSQLDRRLGQAAFPDQRGRQPPQPRKQGYVPHLTRRAAPQCCCQFPSSPCLPCWFMIPHIQISLSYSRRSIQAAHT